MSLRLISQALASWGLLGVLLLAVLDSAGIPLPFGVDLLVIGVATSEPALAYLASALATAGSVLGCLVLFYIARKGGELYLQKHTESGKGRKLRAWFLRYGLVTVFVPALLPIPLPTKIPVISAGALRVRVRPFVLVVLAARIPRYFGLAYLGTQLGENSKTWLRTHAWPMTAAAAGLFLLAYVLITVGGRLVRRTESAG